jgi:membrane protease YdiL (CAAX protease family)
VLRIGSLCTHAARRLDELWVRAPPFGAAAVRRHSIWRGRGRQWWLLGVLVVLQLFNYVLGEELLFRGVLLPRMNGVFGKWDFLANGILFTTYHWHLVWAWPSNIFIDWIYAWVAKRFRSYWMSVILHGSDAPVVAVLFVLAILGMV